MAYLVGSIPTGVLIASFYGVDLRAAGSGNSGATNVARVLGRRAAIFTGLADALKGFVPTLVALAMMDSPWGVTAVAVATVVGHCASVFLFFDGGKGVATGAGALLSVAPGPILLGLVVWVGVFLATRTSSLAALVALPVVVASVLWLKIAQWSLMAVLIAFVVVYRHRLNIARLAQGREHKFEPTTEPRDA